MTVIVDLRAERLNRGLTAEAAAKEMGVPPQVLKRAERGDTVMPHPRNAFKIADFYGYKVTDIWPIEGEPAVA